MQGYGIFLFFQTLSCASGTGCISAESCAPWVTHQGLSGLGARERAVVRGGAPQPLVGAVGPWKPASRVPAARRGHFAQDPGNSSCHRSIRRYLSPLPLNSRSPWGRLSVSRKPIKERVPWTPVGAARAGSERRRAGTTEARGRHAASSPLTGRPQFLSVPKPGARRVARRPGREVKRCA